MVCLAGTSCVVLDLMELSEVARAEFVLPSNGEPLPAHGRSLDPPDTQLRAQLTI
jgi:hypothetical protein